MRLRMAVGLLALLSLSCAPHGRPSPSPSPSDGVALPDEPVAVPLGSYFRELRTVQVTTGGDTLRFLLDTGGGHTLITPQAARQLGCEPFGRTVGHRMSSERVEFQWCPGVPMALEAVSLTAAAVAVFDLGAVLPPELPELDGLLSLKSFADRVVTIDLAGDQLILESARSAEVRSAEQRHLQARVATGEDGSSLTVFLAAEAPSAPVWLLLDSGNIAGTILSPVSARQLQIGEREAQVGQTVSLDVRLMGPLAHRTDAFVRDIIYDGVLGTSFLATHIVTLDLRGREPRVGAAPRLP